MRRLCGVPVAPTHRWQLCPATSWRPSSRTCPGRDLPHQNNNQQDQNIDFNLRQGVAGTCATTSSAQMKMAARTGFSRTTRINEPLCAKLSTSGLSTNTMIKPCICGCVARGAPRPQGRRCHCGPDDGQTGTRAPFRSGRLVWHSPTRSAATYVVQSMGEVPSDNYQTCSRNRVIYPDRHCLLRAFCASVGHGTMP